MAFRARPFVLVSFVAGVTLAWATGCEDDDEDSCTHCCECSNDNDPVALRPEAPGDCSTCEEQCQVLADREYRGVEFDHATDISCPDD